MVERCARWTFPGPCRRKGSPERRGRERRCKVALGEAWRRCAFRGRTHCLSPRPHGIRRTLRQDRGCQGRNVEREGVRGDCGGARGGQGDRGGHCRHRRWRRGHLRGCYIRPRRSQDRSCPGSSGPGRKQFKRSPRTSRRASESRSVSAARRRCGRDRPRQGWKTRRRRPFTRTAANSPS